MGLVNKEFWEVVFKGQRSIDFLCDSSSRLLLGDCGEFFIFIGREEIR